MSTLSGEISKFYKIQKLPFYFIITNQKQEKKLSHSLSPARAVLHNEAIFSQLIINIDFGGNWQLYTTEYIYVCTNSLVY